MDNTNERIQLILGAIAEAVEESGSYDLAKIGVDDVHWLIAKIQGLQREIKELNREIGSYSGTVGALTEEFEMLTGRMKTLKNKMLNQIN